MNVVQTGESQALQRQKQQLRDTASKDEARAQELSRSGVDDLYTAHDQSLAAESSRANADELSKQSSTMRRRGREQNLRGLTNLANGSDRIADGYVKSEGGLSELKGSLEDLQGASEQKSAGLETAKSGLAEQAAENAGQAVDLARFSHLQNKDGRLDEKKSGQLDSLEANLARREGGLQRQGEQLDSYLIAGQSFADGTEIKAGGYEKLAEATTHSVQAEALGDARESQELKQGWAEAQEVRHGDTSKDLAFSSIYHSFKARAEKLSADYHANNAVRDNAGADEMTATSNDLRSRSAALGQQARVLEQSGQCHVAIGRQMQCVPWTYFQGVCLERQGCAELAEAGRLKAESGELRAEAQKIAMQAEELRAKAEDSQARGEEFEVKSHGSTTRSTLLDGRSKEHKESGEKAGVEANDAAAAAARFDAAAGQEKARAGQLEADGVAQLQDGFIQQEEAVLGQDQAGSAFAGELELESSLTRKSQKTTGQAIKTVAKEVSYIGRGKSLLDKLRASHGREAEAQATVGEGVAQLEAGGATSETAHARGVEATKLLEQARELELEGLRLQNRGQKMMLEARPKLAESARLSAISFDEANKAQRQDEEAERLIQSGNQKIAAAGVLREKAERYREIAAE